MQSASMSFSFKNIAVPLVAKILNPRSHNTLATFLIVLGAAYTTEKLELSMAMGAKNCICPPLATSLLTSATFDVRIFQR